MTQFNAMIFAAGFGTRMRYLTQNMPKPLVPVLGKPMIDHAIALTDQAGCKQTIVNTHYHAEQLEKHLSQFPNVVTINEAPNILETGGGLKNALPIIGTAPVVTMNCDMIWIGDNPITQLMQNWDKFDADALLMLLPINQAHGYLGQGDFSMNNTGHLTKRNERSHVPYVYGGVQIIRTEGLKEFTSPAFSISKLWDQMITQNRLKGIVYDGEWVDVGHPEGIEAAQTLVRNV